MSRPPCVCVCVCTRMCVYVCTRMCVYVLGIQYDYITFYFPGFNISIIVDLIKHSVLTLVVGN